MAVRLEADWLQEDCRHCCHAECPSAPKCVSQGLPWVEMLFVLIQALG